MTSRSGPSPSAELGAVMRRLHEAWRARDMDSLRNLYSRSAAFRGIGSDAAEFSDATTFLPLVEVQMSEAPVGTSTLSYLEAYELGEVGWGVFVEDSIFENGFAVTARHSMVFVIEDGIWRCIQHHTSHPVANEEALGVRLTTTLSDLLSSLDEEVLAPLGATEGTATLMFTDIEGSTALAREVGDRAWSQMVEEHDRLLAKTVASHGGTVIKTLGDGALASFGSARVALRCAADIQAVFGGRPFAIRIGIHAGEVVRTGDDVLGLTVNKAARIAAAAAGGQVVMSSIVRELAGGADGFSYGTPFLVELKGLEGVHELTPLDLGRQPDSKTATRGSSAGDA